MSYDIKGTPVAKSYSWPATENGADDPLEVLAEYENTSMVTHMEKRSSGGVTVCAHGGGQAWFSWEDVPILIQMLQQALREKP